MSAASAQSVKLGYAAPEFFALPPKRIIAEDNDGTGRVYFLDRKTKKIVAVGNVPEGSA